MSIYENLTSFRVDEMAGHDHEGAGFYTVLVKATFAWSAEGEVSVADEQRPVVLADVYAGDPASSGPTLPSDYAPYKPMVDLVLVGRLELSRPVDEVDASLGLGTRVRKTVRIFGNRVWLPGVIEKLSLDRPRPFSEMPFEWERSFGGRDPDHPQVIEPRNPVGRGMRRAAKAMEGKLAPNFEDPRHLIGAWDSRPAPVGFGPVAPFWEPRASRAGTYDEAWQERRFPLLPADFDQRHFNFAPEDQQLPRYIPGEVVALVGMTKAGRERFALPPFEVPILFQLPRGATASQLLRPDTIIIEPAGRRLVLVGRVKFRPKPDISAVRRVLVGNLTRGRLRAMARNKKFVPLGRRVS